MTKKHKCEGCGHTHMKKKPKTGNARWVCMAKGCPCVSLIVAGKKVEG